MTKRPVFLNRFPCLLGGVGLVSLGLTFLPANAGADEYQTPETTYGLNGFSFLTWGNVFTFSVPARLQEVGLFAGNLEGHGCDLAVGSRVPGEGTFTHVMTFEGNDGDGNPDTFYATMDFPIVPEREYLLALQCATPLTVETATGCGEAGEHVEGPHLAHSTTEGRDDWPLSVSGVEAWCAPASLTWVEDGDGDGAYGEEDCEDADPGVFPGATPSCGDYQDDDCDGAVDGIDSDLDGDGVSFCQGDCDDTRPESWPGAEESCDGIDNDCDGSPGATEIDGDGDGFYSCEGDCNDLSITTHPGASEVCGGEDEDCDGALGPEEEDADGDGVTPCDGDCDDANSLISPAQEEVCEDGLDNDCNGTVDASDPACISEEGQGDDDTGGDDDATGDDDTGEGDGADGADVDAPGGEEDGPGYIPDDSASMEAGCSLAGRSIPGGKGQGLGGVTLAGILLARRQKRGTQAMASA